MVCRRCGSASNNVSLARDFELCVYCLGDYLFDRVARNIREERVMVKNKTIGVLLRERHSGLFLVDMLLRLERKYPFLFEVFILSEKEESVFRKSDFFRFLKSIVGNRKMFLLNVDLRSKKESFILAEQYALKHCDVLFIDLTEDDFIDQVLGFVNGRHISYSTKEWLSEQKVAVAPLYNISSVEMCAYLREVYRLACGEKKNFLLDVSKRYLSNASKNLLKSFLEISELFSEKEEKKICDACGFFLLKKKSYDDCVFCRYHDRIATSFIKPDSRM